MHRLCIAQRLESNWRDGKIAKEEETTAAGGKRQASVSLYPCAIQMLMDHQRIITVVTKHFTLTHFHVFNRWTRAFQRVKTQLS